MEAQQAAWNNPAAQNFKLNGKCIRHSDPIRTFSSVVQHLLNEEQIPFSFVFFGF